MKTETQTIRFIFTPNMDSTKERKISFRVTLDATAPMTDFVDEAEEMLYEKYPNAEILDTL